MPHDPDRFLIVLDDELSDAVRRSLDERSLRLHLNPPPAAGQLFAALVAPALLSLVLPVVLAAGITLTAQEGVALCLPGSSPLSCWHLRLP